MTAMTGGETETRAYCQHCRKHVTWRTEPVSHGKMLLLTLITFGLWIPMWLAAVFCPTRMCTECGEPIWADAGKA